jgi:Tfp pilus assembly protein PilF
VNVSSGNGRAWPLILHDGRLHLLVITVLGILAYSNTFLVPFLLDDEANIVNNPRIRSIWGSPESSSTVRGKPSSGVLVGPETRPVGYFTFALNYRLSGLHVTSYHVVNLAIHIANALLLYGLVVLSFRTPRLSGSSLAGNAPFLALLAALLFVSHPIQTQAVTYIVQRLASLATLFYLLALFLYVKARLCDRTFPHATVLFAASVLAAVLAMRTKEISFTLPATVLLYDLLFLKGSAKKRLLPFVPMAMTMLIIPMVLLGLTTPLGETIGDIGDRARLATDMPRAVYLFTQFRVITTYVRLLFLPVGQNVDYDFPLYTSFFQPGVFMSFVFLLLLFGGGVYLIVRSRRGEPSLRLAGFGIIWFFVALSVESSVIPIIDVIFEHRVYLPSAGAFTALACGAFLLMGKLGQGKLRTAAIALLGLLPVLCAGAAFRRNHVWRDRVSLWSDVVKKSPGKARAHRGLGDAYGDQGEMQLAVREWKLSIEIDPQGSAKAHYNLGNAHKDRGDLVSAVKEWELALEIDPNYSLALSQLGTKCFVERRYGKAIDYYRRAIKASEANAEAHYNLALLFERSGHPAEAAVCYGNFVKVAPAYRHQEVERARRRIEALKPPDR